MLALALTPKVGGEYGDAESSNSVGWAMVVLAAGYIVAALVALLWKWNPRTKVPGSNFHGRKNLIDE